MRVLFALLLSLFASDAPAQWQVPDHSVPIGRGPGFTGFKSAAPGAAGQSLISQGASRDPIFAAPSAANKVIHVSTAGNDANDGLTWTTAKLTIQAGIDTASTAGKVLVGAGTYTLSTPVYMRSGIALECVPGVIITQANAANLQAIVDFSGFFGGNVATGASIRYCTVDGNRANNTGRLLLGVDAIRVIYLGSTRDVTISENIIQNGPGYSIHGGAPYNLAVINNVFKNIEAGTSLVDVAGHDLINCQIVGNYFEGYGVGLVGLDGCVISHNRVIGTLIGNVATPMRVNTSGTTVTWVSGPNFANVQSGMTIIGNNTGTGFQRDIKQVNSTTSLTIDGATLPTLNNVIAAIGHNDLLGIGGGARSVVSNNYIKSGVSFGLSFYGFTNSKLDQVVISNNIMDGQGKHGFALLGDGGGAGGIGAQNIVISGNIVDFAGFGGPDVCGPNCSSYLITTNNVSNILIDGNHAQDAGNTSNWLTLTSVAVGSVFVGSNNTQVGAVNPGIFGGISSITLSAGWGTTAATSAIVSYGSSTIFTVTANGAGIAANPTITVNTVAAKPAQGANVIYICKQVGGTGAITVLSGEQNSTPAQIGAITFNGTPVAASTYIIQCS
jgi:hypothetical protein